MRLNRLFLILLLILALIPLLFGGRSATAHQVVTSTPFFTSTWTPSPTPQMLITPATGCAAPLDLTLGSSVLLRGGVNVRSEPSVSGALVNYYDRQVQLRLVNGPVCQNGYNWWYVEGVGHPGWVIEGRPGRYFLQPLNVVDPDNVCFEPIALTAGSRVRLTTGLRVHESADQQSRVLTTLPFDTVLDVTGVAACADGLNWWLVRFPFDESGTIIEGWIAEGFPDDYWIQPLNAALTPVPLRCSVPLSLSAGSRGAVTYRDGVPRRLRSAPSTAAPVVLELLDGVAFEVISGATCSEGYNWWQVRILTTGITGWIAEGRPGNYWFEIIAR